VLRLAPPHVSLAHNRIATTRIAAAMELGDEAGARAVWRDCQVQPHARLVCPREPAVGCLLPPGRGGSADMATKQLTAAPLATPQENGQPDELAKTIMVEALIHFGKVAACDVAAVASESVSGHGWCLEGIVINQKCMACVANVES
jgi:hypothetical protein